MDANTFFDNATPAQINQLSASTPQQQTQPAQEQHPAIAASSYADLPQVEEMPEEVAAPEVQALPEPVVVQETEPARETPIQKNWREIREAKLKAEWERDELARRVQALESARRETPARVEEKEEDFDIAPDDVIEGKHLAKIIKHVEQRAERKAQIQTDAMMQMMTENRLKMEMPDLDSIVNQESLTALRKSYPELAQTLNTNPDLYSKAKAAYTLIKKLNIAGEQEPVYAQPAIDKQRIANNSAKPKPIQTVASRQSPLAQSGSYDGELTESLKAQLWKEMNQLRSK